MILFFKNIKIHIFLFKFYIKEKIVNNKFGILRPPYSNSKTFIFFIQIIGNLGLFDKILARILNEEKLCSIDLVYNFVGSLGNIHALLYRPFAINYIPKFKSAVINNILSSPPKNIRNFNREKIYSIFSNLDNLLKRYYSLWEKYEIIENFFMDLSLICIKSNFLDRKIQGLKNLDEFIGNIKENRVKTIKITEICQWIKKHEILEFILDNFHTQIVQRLSGFFKFLLEENIILEEHIERIWSISLKADKETRDNIYELFAQIASKLNENFINIIIDHAIEEFDKKFVIEEVSLIYNLCEKSKNLGGSEFFNKTRNFLWRIIFFSGDEEKKLKIKEEASISFGKLVEKFETKDEIVLKCLENIEKNLGVLNSIEIVKIIVQQELAIDKLVGNYRINQLLNENQIFRIICENLRDCKKILFNNHQEKIYLENICKRVEFLEFLLKDIDNKEVYLVELWEELVINSLVNEEQNFMYCWFQNLPDKFNEFAFNLFIENSKRYATKLTLTGLEFFRTLFFKVNAKKGFTTKNETSSVI